MAVETAASFLEVLEKSKLLKGDQLSVARELAAGAADARSFAKTLVQKELLNRWQAGQLLAGRTAFLWGKYRLVDLLGRGGMGSVFLAWHTMMNRAVALKIISKELGKDAAALERFFTEARAVAALDHPNIVHAYDVANEGDRYYMVMEYVEGRDLQRIVEDKGRLDFSQAVDIIRQAAEGLAHAHSKDMVHCDIKPANLLVNQQGVVKILDMGMARAVAVKAQDAAGDATPDGEALLGTVDYLPPEHALGIEKLDRRSDVYSLGCTFYFALVGHPPFPEGTLPERILKHQTEEPKDIAEDRPDTPSELIRICRKMMAKEPDDRFQTADEVAKVLSEWHPSQAKILKAAPLEEAEAEAEAVEDEVTAEAAPAAKARPAARKRAKESLAAHLLGRAKGWVDYVMADRRRMMIWGGSAGAVVVVIVCGLLLAMVLAVRSARKEQQQVAAKQAAAQKEIKSKSAKDGDFDDFKFKWEEAGPDKPAAEKTATDTTATSSPPPKPGGPPPKPGGPPPKPGAPPPPPGQAPPAAAPAAKTAPPDAKAAPAPAPAAPKSMPAAAPSPPTAPAEKSAKPAVPAKPAEEKKPPAATPKPATPPPAAPAPATPADAFAGFPTFVELPPLPDPDAGEFAGGPTLLGKVHGALDTPVSIELLGKDTALKGRRHFTFEQKDNDEKQQSWIVRIDVPGKEKEDGPADVALLIRDKDGLKFRWADKTPAAVADYLRNCALELRGGGPAHIVGLRKVAIVEPIFFDLQKGISTANVPIEFMPDAANLRVEFTKVEGQAGPLKVERMEKALFNPAGPITPKTPASLSIARKDLRGHQIKGVDFAIMTAVKGKGLTITVRLTYPSAQMYKAGLKSLDANRIDIDQKIRGLPQQFAAAKKEEEKAKIADDFEKKGGEPLWYEDFYKQVHRNGQLHFRVFIEAKDQQIELARTEMPK